MSRLLQLVSHLASHGQLVDVLDEAGHEWRGWVVLDLLGGANLLNLSPAAARASVMLALRRLGACPAHNLAQKQPLPL